MLSPFGCAMSTANYRRAGIDGLHLVFLQVVANFSNFKNTLLTRFRVRLDVLWVSLVAKVRATYTA